MKLPEIICVSLYFEHILGAWIWREGICQVPDEDTGFVYLSCTRALDCFPVKHIIHSRLCNPITQRISFNSYKRLDQNTDHILCCHRPVWCIAPHANGYHRRASNKQAMYPIFQLYSRMLLGDVIEFTGLTIKM